MDAPCIKCKGLGALQCKPGTELMEITIQQINICLLQVRISTSTINQTVQPEYEMSFLQISGLAGRHSCFPTINLNCCIISSGWIDWKSKVSSAQWQNFNYDFLCNCQHVVLWVMIAYRSVLLYQTKISAVVDRGRLKVLFTATNYQCKFWKSQWSEAWVDSAFWWLSKREKKVQCNDTDGVRRGCSKVQICPSNLYHSWIAWRTSKSSTMPKCPIKFPSLGSGPELHQQLSSRLKTVHPQLYHASEAFPFPCLLSILWKVDISYYQLEI